MAVATVVVHSFYDNTSLVNMTMKQVLYCSTCILLLCHIQLCLNNLV